MAAPKRPKILVVDDTEVNISILAEFLAGEYDIDTAASGPQALERVAYSPPDLILLDVMMPGMDGFEVCGRLKSDEPTADIPIIFITALDDVTAETKGLALGAIDFITKPFNPAVVRARVANHLALREAVRLKEDVDRIMRHDLKSPLTAVISLPQLMLMDENLDDGQRAMLQRIEGAGYTLMAMINLSTTLFRMERGNYELRPEDMDLAAVTRKVLAGFAETAAMRRIKLDMYLGQRDRVIPFRGEELLCHSMLCNLVGNALDASPSGETVRVWLYCQDNGGVRIDIVNKGLVPAELRDSFFEKYATSGKDRGTGLGTYSARLIARAHGGDIDMTSGGGLVTVSVWLPAEVRRSSGAGFS
jgi:CheY-like chemotaxis protein